MALTCHVATVDQTALALSGATIRDTLSGRSTCAMQFQDVAVGGYRPALRAELTIEDGAAALFGGLVYHPQESGPGGLLDVNLEATGFAAYLDGVFVTQTFAAGSTPFDVLNAIAGTYLTPGYAITADPTIDDVSALPELVYADRKCSEIVAEVCQLATPPLVWDVTPGKVLRAFVPGSADAPWNVTDADSKILGVPTLTPDPGQYADRIVLRFGTGRVFITAEPHAGNGLARVFPLDIPTAYADLASLTLPAGPTNIGIYGVDDMPWTYRASDNSLYQRIDQTVIGLGETIYVNYTGSFPGTVISDAGNPHPVSDVVTKPDCFSRVTAQALADAIRAQRQIDKVTLEYSTQTPGLAPGQLQSVQLSARGLPAATDFLITDVVRKHLGGTLWDYEITAVMGPAYLGSWRDDWAQTIGGGGGTVVTGGGGGGLGASRVPYFLGGSAVEAVSSPTPAWISASSGAVQVPLNTAARGTTAAVVTVRMKARTAGVSVQARLRNVSDGTIAGSSAVITSTSWTTDTFNVVLTAGVKTYEVEVLPGAANEDVWCVAMIE